MFGAGTSTPEAQEYKNIVHQNEFLVGYGTELTLLDAGHTYRIEERPSVIVKICKDIIEAKYD